MQKLYMGAAFYPEVYGKDLPTLAEDIALMKRGGFNVMRIAEFSWSCMEPHDGVFDFDWLHRIVDTLWENGIHTIMCTPSVTPPDWLTRKYPETLKMNDDGNRRQHGARRHCCSNSRVYRAYTRRINTKLAQEFAGHPAIIGWQLDNEIAPERRGCSCPECMAEFHKRLAQKFGTVEELNRRWYLKLWSQEYESFEDVPHPHESTWSHPSLIEEYMAFQSDTNAEFLHEQAETLRENGVTAPIGTDMMPIYGQSYPKTVAPLDVVQFNHYHTRENLWESAFWHNYMQSLKPDVPFWNTETSTGANGSTAASGAEYPTGFNTMNSFLPYALGGEMNNYWLWRAHPAGHELMHGSVITTQGRPVYNFYESVELAKNLTKAEEFLTGTKTDFGGFVMSVSCKAGNMFAAQPTVSGFNYRSEIMKAYRATVGSGMLPRLAEPCMPLDGVKVLYSPYLATLEEGDFAERLEQWIRGGGVWVAGPMTDIRNADGAKYLNSPYGLIERLTGAKCEYGMTAHSVPVDVDFFGKTGDAAIWTDAFTPAEGNTVLAAYKSKSEPSVLDGMPAALCCAVGEGYVILLGTQPDRDAIQGVLRRAFELAGITPGVVSSPNVLAIPRSGAKSGLIL
jgi:beta-galactosidase GanA